MNTALNPNMSHYIQRIKPLMAALIALFLVGCGSVDIKGEVPRPLVEPVAINTDLVLSDEFKNFSYEELNQARSKISINLGEAQTGLFESMRTYMFSGSDNPEKTLVLTPSIEAFQYSIPRETSSKIYEVWLKYRVMVQEVDGEPIADWLITGYGKTPTALLKSTQAALDAAATVALRDVGSQISIGFRRQPDIKNWLASFE